MATIRKRAWITPKGERKEAWRVAYTDAAGDRRTKQFDRKKDAEAWLTTAAFEVQAGTHTPTSQSITVAKAADLWLAQCRREELEESTIASYEQHVRLHIKPLCGAVKLSALTMPIVQGYRDHWLDNLSRPMAAKVLGSLTSLVKDAQRNGKVAQNVCDGIAISKKKREKSKVVIPTKQHMQQAIAAAQASTEPMALPLMTLLMFAGLRASELRGLPWRNVNLKAQTICIDQRADYKLVIGPPKSASGYRTIAIPALAAQALREWKLRCPKTDDDLVFPSIGKKVMTHRYMTLNLLGSVLSAAGLVKLVKEKGKDGEPVTVEEPLYTLHNFRHACASLWIEQKAEPKRIQDWMGHHSITVTFDLYGHLFEEVARDISVADAAAMAVMGAVDATPMVQGA